MRSSELADDTGNNIVKPMDFEDHPASGIKNMQLNFQIFTTADQILQFQFPC